MIQAETTIPLFPLSLAILPGEEIPLHIFEERYRDMLEDCRKEEASGMRKPIGISMASQEGLSAVGCLTQITEITHEYGDGRLDMVVQGTQRYRIVEVLDDITSYYQARVEWVYDVEEEYTPELRDEAIELHKQTLKSFKLPKPLGEIDNIEHASWLLARKAGLDNAQKQELLEMYEENARLRWMILFYKRLSNVLTEREQVKQRIKANGYLRRLEGIEL